MWLKAIYKYIRILVTVDMYISYDYKKPKYTYKLIYEKKFTWNETSNFFFDI